MLIIYAEDAPVKSNVASWGMSKVNARFLYSCEPPKLFFCPNLRGDLSIDDIPNEKDNIYLGKSSRYWKYVLRILPNYLAHIKLRYEVHLFRKRYVSIFNSDSLILGSFGSDVRSIERFNFFQKQLNIPYSCYFVDEVVSFSTLKGVNQDRSMILMQKVMRKAISNYTITEGLKKYYKYTFKSDSLTVGLPKEEKLVLQKVKEKRQIIHVGGVGDFYEEGIEVMAKYLSKHNLRNPESEIFLRLTVPEIPKYLKDYSDCICVGRLRTDLDLFNEIQNSLCAFLPYDHTRRYSLQTKTSFPSKSIAYLMYARRIFYFGSNETSFFNLLGTSKEIIFCTDIEMFEQKLLDCLEGESYDFTPLANRLPNTDSMFSDLALKVNFFDKK